MAADAAGRRWSQALVVADENTLEAAGRRVATALDDAGVAVETAVFPRREGLLAGLEEVDVVRARLPASGGGVVGVGSGVITDIVRYAAHMSGRDFVSVPTAASMDGYASSVAALQLDGVKVTYPARAPIAIYADPRVAAAAPPDLTRAGIGDLLGKVTANVDWLAAHLLYGEMYRSDVAEGVRASLTRVATRVEPLLAGGMGPTSELLEGLVQSGLAMAAVGNSRPASGCEHHASHFWDLLAAHGRRSHGSHGLQVAYATRFAMRLQRFAFAGGLGGPPRRPRASEDPLGPAAQEWLGRPSAEIEAAVAEKQAFSSNVWAGWPASPEQWDAVRARLAPWMDLFPAVERALDEAGIPDRPGYLEIDEATLRATFRYATRLRARYTVIDFLEGQGALDDAVEAALS